MRAGYAHLCATLLLWYWSWDDFGQSLFCRPLSVECVDGQLRAVLYCLYCMVVGTCRCYIGLEALAGQ